ncbi:baeRF12 domain-containing protein [Ancylobacter lacus]|uniref:baeRF12 domain-containing protein n=1 Tax=Ancylobacter lacus TaxID=2579970 RepID=UPI001BCEC33D|nr:host attachment family protein [Ancylobacter lacus]MBS7537691.1 host attachment protein [Ancylobacter lacus]
MTSPHVPVTIAAGAWVVVCDGRKALILVNGGDARFPNLRTREVREQRNPPAHEQGGGRPGRVHESAGPARAAVEETDLHEQAEHDFLTRLAETLDRAVTGGETRDVILVAPPRALGILRPHYSRALAGAISAEVDRDLVKLPVYEIERHLAA